MNGVQDPYKKTSISSLLNHTPADAASFTPGASRPGHMSTSIVSAAVNHRQVPHGHQHLGIASTATAPYPQGSTYRLEPAFWGDSSNPANKMSSQDTHSSHHNGAERLGAKPRSWTEERGAQTSYATSSAPVSQPSSPYSGSRSPNRPHQQHPFPSGQISERHPNTPPSPATRPRARSIQAMPGIEPNGQVWQSSHDPNTNLSYGVSVLPPIQPEPRPVSNGLQSQGQSSDSGTIRSEGPQLTQSRSKPRSSATPKNGHTAVYQNKGDDQPQASEWQQSERASVRLAVRTMMAYPMPPSFYVSAAPGPYPVLVPLAPTGHSVSPRLQASMPPPPHQRPQASEQAQTEQQSSSSLKRQLPENEVYSSAPKAKRPAKAKSKVGADGTPGPASKRGFNAKKRNEAAQIAAQNAQLASTASTEGKAKGPDPQSSASGEGTKSPPAAQTSSNGLNQELQFARCMSNRYRKEEFPRCVSCTRRWAGDTCRFQGIRCFVKDKQHIVGVMFKNAKLHDAPDLEFPKSWNVPLKQEHIDRCKKVIARALLSTLKAERDHLNLDELIRRARESEVRVTCDTCMTSIFSSSWMCRLCGREACADCFAQVRELTEDRPGATPAELAEMQKKREKHAHSNPFFLSCTKRNEHQASSFSPMSRFFAEELNEAIKEMEEILGKGGSTSSTTTVGSSGEENDAGNRSKPNSTAAAPAPPTPTAGSGASPTGAEEADGAAEGSEAATDWSEVFKSKGMERDVLPSSLLPAGTAGESYIPPKLSEPLASTPYYKICRFSDNELTGVDSAEKFAKIWAYGEPLVVANVLGKFKLEWTPAYFIQEFGDRECLITECEQDANKKTTVKEFFGQFGKYVDRKQEVWKLKDWPPSADFKTAFPKLYKDFSEAVPVPDYVRRDGVYNIGSHFPSNVVKPDLGPKMYNAWAASQNPGCKGSTRLHMDMADAMNIMLYAADCPDGSAGCAVWDIYRAEDSDKIRNFLRKRYALGPHYDPIHGQQYYLDDTLRAQLYKDTGVCSFRVYQRPGEAIFIPAGCAHQVSNLADSIKIAIDYVSPENIDRCAKLTKEFREQNKSKVWKEDILQLKTMMWYGWLSCCRQEKVLRGEVVSNQVNHPIPKAGSKRRADGSQVPSNSTTTKPLSTSAGHSN